jgi:hypothetical protein
VGWNAWDYSLHHLWAIFITSLVESEARSRFS